MSGSTGEAASRTLGIIAGSGPEAGLDLWAKVLTRNQAARGAGFKGDLDAPRVIVLSEPTLGLSMDLETNEAVVWESLKRTAAAVSVQSDAYAIACNTLNWYAPRLEALRLPAEFVSFQSAVADWLAASGVKKVALLGAAPVTGMGHWSAYRALADVVEVEIPTDRVGLHGLILDVKRLGSRHPSLAPRFQTILDSLSASHALLACTELPLIAEGATGPQLVDVTDLVADALVARVLPVRQGIAA
jgi:aspartate racemase